MSQNQELINIINLLDFKKENIVKKVYDFVENLSLTNIKIVEFNKKLDEKYNITYSYQKYVDDYIQYFHLILIKILKLNYKDFEFKFDDKIEDIEERMMFRIELYKNGWSLLQIEKYIYKYFFKENIIVVENELFYLYSLLITYFNLKPKNITKRKGRPSLPDYLREYRKQKHNNNLKNRMKIVYKESGNYNKIKNNLLSIDEFNYIKKVVINDNEKKEFKNQILKKIENFVIVN